VTRRLRATIAFFAALGACRRSSPVEVTPVSDEKPDARADVHGAPPSIRALAAGALATCVTYDDATVRCWGWRMQGKREAVADRWLVPQVVEGLRDLGSPPLALGGDHACVANEGRLACWGLNAFGELGDGTAKPRVSPVVVRALPAVRAVSLGRYFSCAITEDQRVLCWGDNEHGAIGCNEGLLCLGAAKRPASAAMTPTEIPGATGATTIAAGAEHVCAVVWGSNADGQIDASDGAYGYLTEPRAIAGVHDARSLAAGEGHTCAVLATGDVQCWGRNRSAGQLGFVAQPNEAGIKALRSAPVRVAGLAGVTQLAAGLNHTCALTSGGKIACWGVNQRGQLGDGTHEDRAAPKEVVGLTPARAIVAGVAHTCALLEDGSVWCWGWNTRGQLGDGTTAERSVPTPVEGL
jgi:alpha-tubulin suppressor-like RCC1 family protein